LGLDWIVLFTDNIPKLDNCYIFFQIRVFVIIFDRKIGSLRLEVGLRNFCFSVKMFIGFALKNIINDTKSVFTDAKML